MQLYFVYEKSIFLYLPREKFDSNQQKQIKLACVDIIIYIFIHISRRTFCVFINHLKSVRVRLKLYYTKLIRDANLLRDG